MLDLNSVTLAPDAAASRSPSSPLSSRSYTRRPAFNKEDYRYSGPLVLASSPNGPPSNHLPQLTPPEANGIR